MSLTTYAADLPPSDNNSHFAGEVTTDMTDNPIGLTPDWSMEPGGCPGGASSCGAVQVRRYRPPHRDTICGKREMSEMTDTDIRPRMELDAPEWRDFALCRVTDPEAFFPETGENGRPAKRVCAGCEVREACLAEALAHDERFGIWGGLTAAERRNRYPKRRR